jgi:transcriptional regulator with XRE-family HTH domain
MWCVVRDKPSDGSQVTEDVTESRLELGRELRRLRKAAGLTQAAAAKRLPFEQPKLGKIETAKTESVSRGDLELMLDLYGAGRDDRISVRHLVDRIDGGRIWQNLAPSIAFQQVIDAESEAEVILAWHGERVPGQLQSEGYLLQQHASVAPDARATLLRRRRARARLFTTSNPPVYRVVLSEASLYRLPGGYTPGKVVDLAAHLLRLCEEHRNLELQLLPFTADLPFVGTDFVVLQFADSSREKDFAYIEYLGGGLVARRDTRTLRVCREKWFEYQRAALSTEASRRYLRRLAEQDGLLPLERGCTDLHPVAPDM